MSRLLLGLLAACLLGCPIAEPPTLDDDDDFTLGAGDDDDVADDDDAADDDDLANDDDSADSANVSIATAPYPACASPVESPGAYTDAGAGSGVDFVHATDAALTSDPDDLVSAFADVLSTGAVAADLDQDGAVDLFFTSTIGPSQVFWGNGDATFTPGMSVLPTAMSGLANAADYDGDGDLDLLVGGFDHLDLFRLDERTLTNVTAEVGLFQPDGWAGGAAWADWNRDGQLDLYAGGYVTSSETDHETFWKGSSSDNVLYRQDGGVFVDERALLGPLPEEDGTVLHAVWRDMDHDGDVDLIQVNDFGDLVINTFVWENVGLVNGTWTFTERGVAGGVPYMNAPMGCLVEDLDGDGWEELWFSDFGSQYILRGTGGGFAWVDVTLSWMGFVNLLSEEASWSMLGTDLDGDGDLELFIPYGPIPTVFTGIPPVLANQPDRFLTNVGEPDAPDFREAQQDVFPAPLDGLSRAAMETDLNGDGVPDLVVPHIGESPSLLLGQCTENRRMAVELRDPSSGNRFGVGGRITVRAGSRVQTRTLDAGGRGTYSGQDPIAFFGLGTGEDPVQLDVVWPDGATSVLHDVCGHCRVTLSRVAPPR